MLFVLNVNELFFLYKSKDNGYLLQNEDIFWICLIKLKRNSIHLT